MSAGTRSSGEGAALWFRARWHLLQRCRQCLVEGRAMATAIGLVAVVQQSGLENAAVFACKKSGQWRQALGPLALMQQSGHVLDVITYSAAASAAVKGTRRQQALGLLAVMLQSAFEKGEQWLQALGPLALLQQSGLVLDVIAYSAAVSAGVKGTRRQQALDLLAMVLQSGVVPKVIAYDAAGSACAKGGHWHQPLGLLAVMLRSGLGPECNRLQHCHQCL
jgi:hypothetical protein